MLTGAAAYRSVAQASTSSMALMVQVCEKIEGLLATACPDSLDKAWNMLDVLCRELDLSTPAGRSLEVSYVRLQAAITAAMGDLDKLALARELATDLTYRWRGASLVLSSG